MKGGAGAVDLANLVVETIEKNPSGPINFTYSDEQSITEKIETIAKTQYSFSQDPKVYGAPEGFRFDIKDIVINSGSEMIVAIAGDIIRMPGLPKVPQATKIDIIDGVIEGLS